jgi:hypothetical protein
VYTIHASYSGTVNFLASSDSTRTLTVHAPELSSGPTASPAIAGVGQTIIFDAFATDAFGDTLSYAWQFGDSLAATGGSVAHAYTVPGLYSAIVTVSDGRGGSVSGAVSVQIKASLYGTGYDSDGDGFSDGFETSAGSDPLSATSTPLGSEAAPTPIPLVAKSLAIKLNFVKHADSISFSGSLPAPVNFSFTGEHVTVQVSGFVKGFELDAKGHSTPKGNSSFALSKSSKGLSNFTLKVSKTDLSAFFSGAGLTPTATSNTPVRILTTVLFNGAAYQSTESLLFTQKKGMSGSTKTAR